MYKTIISFFICLILTDFSYGFSIETDLINEETHFYKINASIPNFLEEGPYLEEIREINLEIRSSYRELRTRLITDAKIESMLNPDSKKLPYTLEVSYILNFNPFDALSFIITSKLQSKNEYPIIRNSGYVIGNTGRYYLEDLFIDSEAAIDSIYSDIYSQIEKKIDRRGYIDYHPNIIIDKSMYTYFLRNEYIIIIFNRGSISPKDSRTPVFVMNLNSFKNNLKKRH